jgi:hypothetical protein
MLENIKRTDLNKNVMQVWTQEPDFTGYKGFDFTAIDDLESLIKDGLIPYTTGIKGILENNSINVNQLDLNYLTDNISVSGDVFYYISGIHHSLTNGVNTNQLDLNASVDSVNLGGKSLDYLSGIATEGVSLKGVNTVNVNVTGGNLNVINEVEIKNEENNPVPVSGTVTANLFGFSAPHDANIPLQITEDGEVQVYLQGFNSNLASRYWGTVTAQTEKSSTISNSTPGSTNGAVLNANANRKELYIQNLSTGNLYIKYGQNASDTSFNFVLAANSVSNAGDGGSLSDQAYTGIVSVSGVSPSYISWERS